MSYVLPEISRYRGEFIKNYILIGRAEGCRVIVKNERGVVTIFNSRGEDRTRAFRRVADELDVGDDDFIVEGDLLINGELFTTAQLCRRTVNRFVKIDKWELSFNDMLEGYHNDTMIDITTQTEARIEALQELTQRIENVPDLKIFQHGDFKSLRQQAVYSGNVGVLYRRKGRSHQCSTYDQGSFQSALYQRLIFIEEEFYVGGGYYGFGKNSEMLGGIYLFRRNYNGAFYYVGKSGVHNPSLNKQIMSYIEENPETIPPVPLENRDGNIFCRMGDIKVVLEYKGISRNGGFHFPVIKSLTTDEE